MGRASPSMAWRNGRMAHPCGTSSETVSSSGGVLGDPAVNTVKSPTMPVSVSSPPKIMPPWRVSLSSDTRNSPVVAAMITRPTAARATGSGSPQSI